MNRNVALGKASEVLGVLITTLRRWEAGGTRSCRDRKLLDGVEAAS